MGNRCKSSVPRPSSRPKSASCDRKTMDAKDARCPSAIAYFGYPRFAVDFVLWVATCGRFRRGVAERPGAASRYCGLNCQQSCGCHIRPVTPGPTTMDFQTGPSDRRDETAIRPDRTCMMREHNLAKRVCCVVGDADNMPRENPAL